MAEPTLSDAERLDADDPLAPVRDRFVVTDPDLVYVDGNSLGRLPKATVDRLARTVAQEWGTGLVRSWEAWIDLPTTIGDRIAADVVGARPGEVIVADSTTVNLYKVLVAALDLRPGRSVIVTDGANFPTDRFVIEGVARARGLTVRTVAEDPSPSLIAEAVAPGDVAVVALSLVAYRSGARLDGPAITSVAHDAGALAVWDLSHAAGAIPLSLESMGADFAVGCTYKYLNGGPGAPAWLYARQALHGDLVSPIWGWFGAADPFAMTAERYRAAPGVAGFLSGTPPILALAAVDEGVSLTAEIGLGAIDAKRRRLMDFAFACSDAALAPVGVTAVTPSDADDNGSHVSLAHPAAWPITQFLIAEAGVIPDFREPDLIRLGLTPLSTAFVDVWRAVDGVRRAVVEGELDRYPSQRGRVT